MKYSFTAKGHPNILATHKTTLEITKDAELSIKGNCIVAVGADFSVEELRKIAASGDKIRLTIAAAGMKDEIIAVANKGFCDKKEIVLRKGSFLSERTLGNHADKAAADLDSRLVERLNSPETTVSVSVETI